MAKKIFLSFRYTDSDLRNDLEGLFQARQGPIEATPVYCKRSADATTEAAIRKDIQASLEGCRGVLVVPGDDAHSSKWIKYEVNVARSAQLPCAVVRHPQSKGGVPPDLRSLPELAWDPHAINEHVRLW